MHGRLACAALCALLLLIPTASAAADDSFSAPKPLFFGVTDASVSNVGATVQTGETLTQSGLGNRNACVRNGNDMTYSQVGATMWWILTGTGRPVTVTTAGSTFDTHLGIFAGGLDGDVVTCQDGEPTETVTFDSIAGQPYRIQVGGCLVNMPEGCGTLTGLISLRATSPAPANDQRAAAAALPTGQIVNGDNYAAGAEESGEPVACGAQPYGRTVWYRWTAPSAGRVLFTVSDPNAAIAVFNAANQPVGCEATPGGDARLALDVTRGDLLVQVGGVGVRSSTSDPATGRFSIQAAFTESSDRDGDGVTNDRDCRPDDGRVHPGARDVPRNGVDENCNGRDANYPQITSRARLGVQLFAGYSKVTAISARSVPAGAKVQLRCSGRSCPFRRTRARTLRRSRSSVSLMTASLRSTRILPTTTLEVRVTRTGRIGKVMRFRFRRLRSNPVLQTLCLVPGASRPARC
jgi:hypothetical protein